jgi:Protein of unknown function (DUF2510)/Matrixin
VWFRKLPSMAGKGERPETPREPGWYPDPWSATGEGERYFDGKRWGSTERPRGRLSGPEPRAVTRLPSSGRRRLRGLHLRLPHARPVIALLVLVAIAVAIVKLRPDSGTGSAASPREQAAAAGAAPPASREEASRPLGTPAPAPPGEGGYEFLQHQPGKAAAPVAFDPCRPVHYVINRTGEPSDGEALVAEAIARLHDATGLDFVADGPTTETPDKQRPPYQPDRYDRSRWAPVLIAWADQQSFPSLAGYIAGVGSPQAMLTDSRTLAYVTGQVVLDREQLDPATLPDRGAARAIIMHELGHLVGLDHTADQSEIMYSEAQFNVQEYGAGDRRGLALLGTQACYPQL